MSSTETGAGKKAVGGLDTAYIQALRGLACLAVVLIHCLPQDTASVCVRPFLNWCVALFIFLSGFLTTKDKVLSGDWKGVCGRRLRKTLLPYAVWSLVYAAIYRPDPLKCVLQLATGTVAAHLYFLVAYAQLVLLTPLVFRLLSKWRWVLYAVTPVTLVVCCVARACGVSVTLFSPFFGS